MTSEERIIAYVDGELPPQERARFEAEMAADPAFAAAVARHRALADRVSAAYAPVLDEAIPPQLLATAHAANDRGAGRPRGALPQWTALAASLVVGVVAGRLLWPQTGGLAEHGGVLVAEGPLDKALTHQLSAQPGVIKVGLSFRTGDGRYCRTFESAPDRVAGLACRRGDRWVAHTVTAWSPAPATTYRTAGSDTPPEILASVDNLISGEALGPAAERAARARGWR